ncbi:MAG: acyltransferase, partial [Spirochaetia bacterium]|nr:acyltransferase [Spirochaetia bacterium]
MFGWIRTGLLSLFKDKPGEVPFLHGARATAIILVTIMHFWEFKRAAGMPEHPGWVDTILDGFTSGVDLFFVISGFLIYGILRREYLDRGLLRYRNFYFRRFMRIVPGYAAFLFVTVLSAFYYYSRQPVFGGQANIVLAGVRRVWADALFLSDYLPSMHVHTWSVAVEEKFYILLPIAAGFLIFKLGLRARLIIWTTGIIIVTVVRYLEFQAFSISALNFKQYLYFPAHARLDSFLIGILIAELEIHSYILALGKRAGAVAAILTTSIILLAAAHMVSLAEYPLFFSVFRFNALGIGFGGLVLTG